MRTSNHFFTTAAAIATAMLAGAAQAQTDDNRMTQLRIETPPEGESLIPMGGMAEGFSEDFEDFDLGLWNEQFGWQASEFLSSLFQTPPVGTSPTAVATGDLNGDGDLDLAVANVLFDDNVSVLLGAGDGTFAPQQTFAAGDEPQSVAIGDLNGDGNPDLAVANGNSDDVSVLLGAGDGTFAPQQTFAAGDLPRSVAIGDLDGDGALDLAVANDFSDNVSILLGVGDGTFAPEQTFAAGDGPISVAIGDLDGDADLDLAVANRNSDNVSVLLGAGDGTFAPQQTFDAGDFARSVAIGDLDGDGNPDLAVANRFSADVSVLLGAGDGTFEPQQTFLAGGEPFSLAIGDLDADGDLDLAVANSADDNVSVLLNTGDEGGQIIDTSASAFAEGAGVPGFGSRTASLAPAADPPDFARSPVFASEPLFGAMGFDALAMQDDGSLRSVTTIDTTSGLINTRLMLRPGGDVEVLQVADDGSGEFLPTEGQWIPGQVSRFVIEVASADSVGGDVEQTLTVFQDGVEIFQGHDIVQELEQGPGGMDALFIEHFGGGVDALLVDNFNPALTTSADLNGDGVVDGVDLGLLLLSWDPAGPSSGPADIDGDGKIDGADLGLLLLAWSP